MIPAPTPPPAHDEAGLRLALEEALTAFAEVVRRMVDPSDTPPDVQALIDRFLERDSGEWRPRAALSSISKGEGNGWRPIETAPKDGTAILVWFFEPNLARVCRYTADPKGFVWAAGDMEAWNARHARWWMPVPKPPLPAPPPTGEQTG